MNKSINFCHYPHSMCNPALYCNAAYLVIYETTVDHINNDEIHVSTTDRSKLDSIEAIQEKLNNIDLSKYVTNDNVSSIVQDYVDTQNYLTEVPSYYTTDEELSNTMTGLATIDNVTSILNNKYYTRSQIDELLRVRKNQDIHITDVDFDGSQLIITESDGSVYKTAVSFSGGYSSVTITIYKRSENKPEIPTGGDYDFDNNQFIATDLTEGWYANKSDEDDSLPLWMSQRIFLGKKKITEEDEDLPQNGEWSEPVKLSGNNSTSIIEKPVSASHVEVVYHKAIYTTSATGQIQSAAPNTPIGGSYDFVTKEFTVPHNPVDETDLWSTTVSNDSYTITNSDGTTQTIYYTWYFSIGSIGEGESDFTWTAPAVYGVDYTQVAYNMRFIAVDYSVLAQNVKFTTGDFQTIANNITLKSEQLTAIAKNVTIKSEEDLKLIANNVSIDTTGIANSIDKQELVDKLMQQEGYSEDLAKKIAENGTMQMKTGLLLQESNVFIKNVSDRSIEIIGKDVDTSVNVKIEEIQQDIEQHKQNLIDQVNGATSDENIKDKVTSIVKDKDYVAIVAKNVVLDQDQLEIIANNVDVFSKTTTFTGTVQATQFAFGESQLNQETGKLDFIKRCIFTKNRYTAEDGSIKKYNVTLEEDTPVIVILDKNETPIYVLDMTNLNTGGGSGNDYLTFDYYQTFEINDSEKYKPASVKISNHAYMRLYLNLVDNLLYRTKNENLYSDPYTGYVYSIQNESKNKLKYFSVANEYTRHSLGQLSDKLGQLNNIRNCIVEYTLGPFELNAVQKKYINNGASSDEISTYFVRNAICDASVANKAYILDDYRKKLTYEGEMYMLFQIDSINNEFDPYNVVYNDFSKKILNIAKIIDNEFGTTCYNELLEVWDATGDSLYATNEYNNFQRFSNWITYAYYFTNSNQIYPNDCPEELFDRIVYNISRWKGIQWEENPYGPQSNDISYFFTKDSDNNSLILNISKEGFVKNLNITAVYGTQSHGYIPVYETVVSEFVNDYNS